MLQKRVCIPGELRALGGPASFQARLTRVLAARGIRVIYNLKDRPYDVVLVIAGIRNLAQLARCKLAGTRIVQRLNGINWIHRMQRTSLRQYLIASVRNWLMVIIRNYLADHVVYQSQFVRSWWEKTYGPAPVPSTVIYNGVDLQDFTPNGPRYTSDSSYRVIVVEGNLLAGYERALFSAVRLCEGLRQQLGRSVELLVIGNVAEDVRERLATSEGITWIGRVPGADIPFYDRSAHLFFSSDLNSACPNSVIEAMACGVPVVAYDTGALPELLGDEAGRCVSYGANPWRLKPPSNSKGLLQAAMDILQEHTRYQIGARQRAKANFDVERMADWYLDVLFPNKDVS